MNTPNFDDSTHNLDKLLEEVQSLESTLAGGKEEDCGKGTTAIQKLKETKVSFGNPKGELILLTEEGFKEKGLELSYDIKQLMNRYDFHSMMINVNIKAESGVQISTLKLNLDFHPKGKDEPIVHKIFPESKWQKMLDITMGMNLGLNAGLDFNIGVDQENLDNALNLLNENSELKANLSNKNSVKFGISASDFSYKFGKFNLVATGDNSSKCEWTFEKPEIKDQSSIKFFIIFKVPKGKKQIDLIGKVWVEPDINGLCENILHIFKDLSQSLKNFFVNEQSEKFAIGKKETWNNLDLPNIKGKKFLGIL